MIYGLIPARAGSKRLPGKNTMSMCGKSLIVHTIEVALQSKRIDKIFVSTDDTNVMDIMIALLPEINPHQ